MPSKTTRPFNNPALHPMASRPVHSLGSAFRLTRAHIVASTLGFLLFGPVTAFALELGEASMKSGLGQSLVVEIPYRLAANEQLTASCVGLTPARGNADALPTYTQVSRVSISSTHIQIFGVDRIREPLIGLNVDVRCATLPHFVRSYQLFVDPPSRVFTALSNDTRVAAAAEQSALDATASVATSRLTATLPRSGTAPVAVTERTISAPTTSRDNPSLRARGRDGGEIAQGQTYRVVRGDTLSGIAARVAGRPGTIRETADTIFAVNREAFARGNRDLLEAGRSITIPMMGSTVAQPLPAVDAASAVAPDAIETFPAIETLPAATPAVGAPTVAPATVPNHTEPAPAVVSSAPNSAPTERTAPWLTALLALGAVILLSAPLAFARRRRDPYPASRTDSQARKSPPRQAVASVAGIEVVEDRLPRTSADDTAATIASAGEIEPPLDPTERLDIDVGVPVVMEERVDWFGRRAGATHDTAVRDDTVEETAATTRMPDVGGVVSVPPASSPSSADLADPPVDDEQMTMTIVELDMLRQDYEAEHTLTQQASKALQNAVADLEATKARRAATAETAELPQPSPAETITARVRTK